MMRLVLMLWLSFVCVLGGGEVRSFDKQSYRGTVWAQANPWFSPSDKLGDRLGGTDFGWHAYPAKKVDMWKKVAEVCAPYGFTGLQMEVALRGDKDIHHMEAFKPMLDGFQAAGNGFKGMPFINTGRLDDYQALEKQWDRYFDYTWPILSTHPNACRVDGRPVMTLYGPSTYSRETWIKLRRHLDEKYGKTIMLFNTWSSVRKDPERLEALLQVFDGVTAYGNWEVKPQREHMKMLAKIMKKYPNKIFEASVHNTYTQHYNYGGIRPRLTAKYRASMECALEAQPDSLVMTNFYDIYENSRILPSYELEDFLLEYMRYRTASWRNHPYVSKLEYNFYLSNYTSLYAGENLGFELVVLPGRKKAMADVALELVDGTGKLLHRTAPLKVDAGAYMVHVWTLPASDFHQYREVYPRLSINGKPHRQSPPTMISPTMRSHLLWFTRSLKNQLEVKGDLGWTLCGAKTGTTIPYPENGVGHFRATFGSPSNGTPTTGGGTLRLLRNGRELLSYGRWNANVSESFALPNPGEGCDAYALELINQFGVRYRTPSIFVSGKRYGKNVRIPIVKEDSSVLTLDFQADRVPCFYYPMSYDSGSLLVDASGYWHDGFMGGSGYGGGHLRQTGYRHEHYGGLGGTRVAHSPSWHREGNRSFLRFGGSDYICVQGGTAFPYAFTLEFDIRPKKGPSMGVLGAGNNQLQMMLRGDGKFLIRRTEGPKYVMRQFIVQEALPWEQWSHVAVTYDAVQLKVYINGKECSALPLKPLAHHEMFNAVVLGATCKVYNQPDVCFRGDLAQVRFYGRNLSPREFLMHEGE